MIIQIEYPSSTSYFIERIKSIAKLVGSEIELSFKKPFIYIDIQSNENAFIQELDKRIYNSLFYKNAKVVETKEGRAPSTVPSSVYLCPECLEEMLDENSRRYYYPFTSCKSCGYQSPFIAHYPYERKNTLLTIFKPCKSCQEELKKSAFRQDYPLISCIDCNIPLKLANKSESKILFANEKDEYKRVFELLAGAIKQGKSVVMKTMRGYKRFFKEKSVGSKVMLTRPSEAFLMLAQEKRALFSIERPIMYATSSEGSIEEVVAVWDGFTTLLAKEVDEDCIYFDERVDEYELKLDFDLPITFYEAPRYFINKHFALFKEGSESLFPKSVETQNAALYHDWLMYDGLIDKVDHFQVVAVDRIITFQDEPIEHSHIVKEDLAKSQFLGLLVENRVSEPTIGVYFGESVKFFYYRESVKELFDFGKIHFEPKRKVVERFKERYRDRFAAFEKEESMLLKAARLLGFDGDFEAFNKMSLSFGGKGGVSIDCRIEEGFDYSSFYSSIMSFVLADTPTNLIAYSIFESLGDFLSNQAVSLYRESKAIHIALCGRYIANSAFFSRFIRNTRKVLLNIEYPIDGVGALGSLV